MHIHTSFKYLCHISIQAILIYVTYVTPCLILDCASFRLAIPHPKLARLYQIIKSRLGFLCFNTEIYLQNTLHFGKPAVHKYGVGFQFSNVTDKFTPLPVISSASGRI
jgi:hypothetical protein